MTYLYFSAVVECLSKLSFLKVGNKCTDFLIALRVLQFTFVELQVRIVNNRNVAKVKLGIKGTVLTKKSVPVLGGGRGAQPTDRSRLFFPPNCWCLPFCCKRCTSCGFYTCLPGGLGGKLSRICLAGTQFGLLTYWGVLTLKLHLIKRKPLLGHSGLQNLFWSCVFMLF